MEIVYGLRDSNEKGNVMNIPINKILQGDSLTVLKTLPSESIDLVVTSPPYWNMRDYKIAGQLGLENTFGEYLAKLLEVFKEVKRILKPAGNCFVNLGDTYGTGSGKDENRVHAKQGSLKGWIDGRSAVSGYEKSLLMLPERFAIGMIEQGYKLRNKIIWHKKNAMPSSVTDRLSNKYEFVFYFSKSSRNYFDLDAIRVPFETAENRPEGIVRAREYGYNTKQGTKQRDMENDARRFPKRRPPGNDYARNPKGKNPGDVWTLTLQPHPDLHIAMFPEKLIEPMILAGCPMGGVCLDPFLGSGTTAVVAKKQGRNWLGVELNPSYIAMAEKRINGVTPSLFIPVDNEGIGE